MEKEVTQEITELARVFTPEKPEQNSEGEPQEDNQGIGQGDSPDPTK